MLHYGDSRTNISYPRPEKGMNNSSEEIYLKFMSPAICKRNKNAV